MERSEEPKPAIAELGWAGHRRSIPIADQLFIGRECPGVERSRRFLLSGDNISRNHCEIRLDLEHDRAFLIDTSTNGTLLDGKSVERGELTALQPGSMIRIGDEIFEFRSARFGSPVNAMADETAAMIQVRQMVLVVGDIINYSAIAQHTDPNLIANGVRRLWNEVGAILERHGGTLNHYAGDAIYSVWDRATDKRAAHNALDFCRAAHRRIAELGTELGLGNPDGSPIAMGWAIVVGPVAVTSMTRRKTVIGDTTNLVFRLSGLAGRDGRAPIVVSEQVRLLLPDEPGFGDPESVLTKGRTGTETIYPISVSST
ncbi:MAG: adenylate/guanylate cyclase domain-containing protein [Nocardiaceae bacterium]|nr:adenylate/guanylate cyclase domain-containing protein [Nocardiaceae bacterium]